jgi:general nucleoside transport system ATP-binding protein
VSGGGSASAGPPPAVEVSGLTKNYGAVAACDAVNLQLHRGEIHGILGENGAGKSTLMKMLIGLVVPDAGRISIDGASVRIMSPLEAAQLGIGMVHQHFSLIEALTVWENVALGDRGKLSRSATRASVAELGEQYGLRVDPDVPVGDLPVGLRQRVEILKCLRRQPEILIFDEPTSVLTPEESEDLFASLRQVVNQEDRAVALVSHKLTEILSVTDRVTIMRNGQVVNGYQTDEVGAAALAQDMVGREVRLRSTALGNLGGSPSEAGEPEAEGRSEEISAPTVLELRGLEVRGPEGVVELDDFMLSVRAGEIVGVAGVEGNGQKALVDALSGLQPVIRGEVLVDGEVVEMKRLGASHEAGVAIIPEDRHDSGLVMEMSLAENLMLADPEGFSHRGVIDRGRLDALTEELIERFGIMCTGPHAPLWTLSGGNQQRAVLAREMTSNPKVLVASQPTRGLDVGAIEYMAGQLRQAADDGVGVLLISSELDEIFELADRIVVIFRGQITGEMTRATATREKVGRLMGGDLL